MRVKTESETGCALQENITAAIWAFQTDFEKPTVLQFRYMKLVAGEFLLVLYAFCLQGVMLIVARGKSLITSPY